jgi:hypothetical protein
MPTTKKDPSVTIAISHTRATKVKKKEYNARQSQAPQKPALLRR